MSRDHLLDGLKGLAVAAVIFIHSVFWSGDLYVPAWMHGACLWIDVPLFFFLAGWSFSKVSDPGKAWRNLWRLQWRYMTFVALVWLGYRLADYPLPAIRLLEWFLHDYHKVQWDDAVMGSMWFVRVYLGVSVAAIVLIWFHARAALPVALVLVGAMYFSQLLPAADWTSGWLPIVAFGVFYLPLFLLGYCRAKGQLAWYWYALIAVQAAWQLLCTPDLVNALINLQAYKFPAQSLYFSCSWLSLCVLLLLTRLPALAWLLTREPLRWLGRNAIHAFFAQGISTTLLYIPVGLLTPLHPYWLALLVPMFALNLYCAVQIARLLKALERLVVSRVRTWLRPTSVQSPARSSSRG
ncbi:peptidoglycan/LPS O-acetylase OafA/YrhL [Silvimonas terrae]|uniref:Peptidoglycan/LPS O-acetylase OafA/YrhL n=1 Tax=Silvimonas terrae TaxID=300266 RepID=A0A840RLQ1_9NEIS|nr:acyltransferase family protein [Silvimonas terrae]MBB5193534.1 peptidoglycan/LPS O-acetylase OafA/YrhL [Silvimonas terrae]